MGGQSLDLLVWAIVRDLTPYLGSFLVIKNNSHGCFIPSLAC